MLKILKRNKMLIGLCCLLLVISIVMGSFVSINAATVLPVVRNEVVAAATEMLPVVSETTVLPMMSEAQVLSVVPIGDILAENGMEEKQVVIDGSTIQMVTTRTDFAYSQPSEQSNRIFNISGGSVVNADIHSLGNDFITIEYHNKICYLKCESVKVIVGNTQAITDHITMLKETYQYVAETAVDVVPAPHHYSINGNIICYSYQDYIWSLCVKFGIEDYFTYLLAQFYLESRFNQNAISGTSDYGICQLNRRYHNAFKSMVGHPEWDVVQDPYANMYCGVYFMSQNIKNRGGNIDIAMTDYNAGPGYYHQNGVRHVYTDTVHHWRATMRELD